MKILTIATTNNITLILQENEKILDSLVDNSKNRQAEISISLTEEILRRNGLFYDDMDAFASVLGPGSFLGLKVSASILKALHCIYPKIAIIGSSIFEILCWDIPKDNPLSWLEKRVGLEANERNYENGKNWENGADIKRNETTVAGDAMDNFICGDTMGDNVNANIADMGKDIRGESAKYDYLENHINVDIGELRINNNLEEQTNYLSYVVLECGVDGFYILDRTSEEIFYSRKEDFHPPQNSLIITNFSNAMDFLKSYNTFRRRLDINDIVSLNYHKYMNGIFSGNEIIPLYIREPQINRKNE